MTDIPDVIAVRVRKLNADLPVTTTSDMQAIAADLRDISRSAADATVEQMHRLANQKIVRRKPDGTF